MKNHNILKAALWSIAIPGLGQLANGKYLKGFLLLFLEFLINVKSGLNTFIIYSFHLQTTAAVKMTDYQWLMFYPCHFMFAIWDACHDAGAKENPLFFLPFSIAAYTGTIGVIYSSTFTIANFLPGPLWLMILFSLLGFGAGFVLMRFLGAKGNAAADNKL